MRAAVDSSILLDVLLDDPQHGERSQRLLDTHAAKGALVLCPIAYAEAAAAFTPSTEFHAIARDMGLVYDEFTSEIAAVAGQMWQEYRRRGGPRSRILSDFMIGAHALLHSERLLARDRGFFRDYFHGLEVVTP